MTYRDSYDDDPDTGPDLTDRDLPDETDTDDSDGSDTDNAETIPCPYCRKPLFEGAEFCPRCKNYLSAEDAPRRYPWWLVAGVILCLVLVLLWAL